MLRTLAKQSAHFLLVGKRCSSRTMSSGDLVFWRDVRAAALALDPPDPGFWSMVLVVCFGLECLVRENAFSDRLEYPCVCFL